MLDFPTLSLVVTKLPVTRVVVVVASAQALSWASSVVGDSTLSDTALFLRSFLPFVFRAVLPILSL